MQVRQLIELLKQYQEDAQVRIMTQQTWPFENHVHGVCSREEALGLCRERGDYDCPTCHGTGADITKDTDELCPRCNGDMVLAWEELTQQEREEYARKGNNGGGTLEDVFIVEGGQICYGIKGAWEER